MCMSFWFKGRLIVRLDCLLLKVCSLYYLLLYLPLFVVVFAATVNPPNQYAVQALKIHYKNLMRAAQNIAVGLQAKGLLLAGDNQVANDPFFRSITKVI